jgi:hypothetical protein
VIKYVPLQPCLRSGHDFYKIWKSCAAELRLCFSLSHEHIYRYGQSTWCVSDRYEQLVTVAVEVLAISSWKHLSQVSVLDNSSSRAVESIVIWIFNDEKNHYQFPRILTSPIHQVARHLIIILMCHIVNVKCPCNTVYTQLFFFIEKPLLLRHVSELIAPSSGRTSLRRVHYCNAFGLSLTVLSPAPYYEHRTRQNFHHNLITRFAVSTKQDTPINPISATISKF